MCLTRASLPLLLGLMFHAPISQAAESKPQSYPIPGHGALELTPPQEWRSNIQQPPGELPPSITLRPAAGEAFLVRITPLWNPGQEADVNSDAKIKEAAENVKIGIAPTAVEKELQLKQLKGPAAHGYYFTATDNAPRPGEFACMTSAVVGVGNLLLSVTILHQAKEADEVQKALEILQEARQSRPESN